VTAVVALEVVSSVEPWQAVGLHVVDGRASVGGIELRFRAPIGDEAVRIDRWVMASPRPTPTPCLLQSRSSTRWAPPGSTTWS
jgi:hypothetical protein